ncbi:unnamed protein product [Rotaria sp. Silwood2]|nr:unnamed protein product [Rotaria sp. Silwood2]CAF3378286.1 unnamed protein product [Rotaria sp. Silwood2]CAF4319524.1 unnamed protein product [Rotaria sp. Silwood2]CAF4325964.1 unnamed protein product [Rotaria sp. Silwood2]
MYQCQNSTKYISKHRLVDGIRDCPFDDDETFNQSCSLNDVYYRFTCSVNNNEKCFAPLIIGNGVFDCEYGEDERGENQESKETHIYFQRICDGIEELLPMLIDGRYETDETGCIYWQCNNTYTRCDGFWSCNDGADEVNCPSSNCPKLQHTCVFPNDTSKVSCLSIDQVGDGIVDCLGASDERNYCRTTYPFGVMYTFQCLNETKCISSTSLCDSTRDCSLGDDEAFCKNYDFVPPQVCSWDSSVETEVQDFLHHSFCIVLVTRNIYFILRNMPTYSLELITEATSHVLSTQKNTQSVHDNPIIYNTNATERYCNRGIPIYILMNNKTHKLHCLCPPSYYGDTCEYQNQRVSVTFQIRTILDWRIVFTFIITLIDDEGYVESHDYFEYLSIRDCDTKFNVYLLYSTRPKNTLKNYSVRIDAFNKLTLSYRASWIFPLRFPFLPVNRLSTLIVVPNSDSKFLQRCTPSCIHGQCSNYVNNPSSTFCRCEPGWSGTDCTIKHECDCASNSLCIGDSICVCPLNRFGPRCYLLQSSCHPESCANDGQCVPGDARHTPADLNKPTCICPQGYSGDRCEYQLNQTRIDVSFHNELTIPSSLLVHLITVQNEAEPIRTSTMKKIAFHQSSFSFYTSITFNIAFAEMFTNYYVIILREQASSPATINTQIIPSYRCPSIHELFNTTLANQHLLKRIKYYHILCQERLELVCFYDDVHFCLCDLARQANCFEFDHNMTYHCHGYNLCENGGHCFQDDPKCPISVICACFECYYGSRCQFSTKGSTLSLDIILGYQIRPNVGISRQSTAIKITLAITTIMLGFGFISSLFSFLTFQREKTRNVGCGIYLLTSSITSMITMSVFTVKFWFLLASHMGSIKNRSFLHVQCVSMDFLLRLLLSIGDWLSACVAIERAVNVSKGINFDKTKSKQIAKWVVLIVFLFTSCTHIHDPIHRHLIDDDEEQRTWCVTKYSSSIQMLDWFLNILHFSIPFGTNCISALIIIITTTRTHSNVQKKQSYKKILREQFQYHKHLLISPFILVLLALPRLIISFLFGCMKSARNPWFYLIGYFISFIPPMLTFAIFVLPSEIYKKEFNESIKRFWKQ